MFLGCGGHGCARISASVASGGRSDLVRVPRCKRRKREEVGGLWVVLLRRGLALSVPIRTGPGEGQRLGTAMRLDRLFGGGGNSGGARRVDGRGWGWGAGQPGQPLALRPRKPPRRLPPRPLPEPRSGGEFVNNRLAFGGLSGRRRPHRCRRLAAARSDRARANWERGHPEPAARGGRRCRRRRAQCARGGAGGGGGCSRRQRRPGQRGQEARRVEPSAARWSAVAGERRVASFARSRRLPARVLGFVSRAAFVVTVGGFRTGVGRGPRAEEPGPGHDAPKGRGGREFWPDCLGKGGSLGCGTRAPRCRLAGGVTCGLCRGRPGTLSGTPPSRL